jgi:hypothetical protein
MVHESIIKVLDRAMYYVTNVYGGAPNLISHLERLDGGEGRVLERVHKLLSHYKGVHVISPWELILPLFQGDDLQGFSLDDSIVPEVPYSVFTWEGDLLYKVSNHLGWFGYSPLDKTLALQSLVGDMYFLQYRTYGHTKTILLLVNNPSLSNVKVLSNKALQAPLDNSRMEMPSDNVITLFCTSIRPTQLTIYHWATVPNSIPTLEQVKGSIGATKEVYYIEPWDDKILWFPKASGWVYMETDKPINISRPLGDGVDRFTQATQFVWYIAVGRELNTMLVRPGANRKPPELSREGIIRLEVNLS